VDGIGVARGDFGGDDGDGGDGGGDNHDDAELEAKTRCADDAGFPAERRSSQ